jgi:hypothetical protein
MSGVDVTIAIVTYRSADLTIDCLSSIQPERLTASVNIRVIVVDNASGDARLIAKAIEENGWRSWVTLVAAPKNGGFAYGINLALQRATADGPPKYLHILNPDTIVRHGAIGALVRFLDAHPDIGIVGSSFELQDGSEWPVAFRFPSLLSEVEAGLQFWLASRALRRWIVPKVMTPAAQPADWVVGASMMIRWRVIDRIGGFDANYFLYFEETDFCFRARSAGFSTWYVPESRVMHIGGQSSHVTNRKAVQERFPAYWFESRRRYFAVNRGMSYAMIVDVVTLLAHGLGFLKRMTQRRRDKGIPYFFSDLLRYSTLWPSNRLATSRIRATRLEDQMPEELIWWCNKGTNPSRYSRDRVTELGSAPPNSSRGL